MAAAVHRPDDERDFYAKVLLWLAAWPVAFGWLFLVAGTGIFLLATGLLMVIVGVALSPSWKRAAFGLLALAIGGAPIWFLLAWLAIG
jgi:hypothetical protein